MISKYTGPDLKLPGSTFKKALLIAASATGFFAANTALAQQSYTLTNAGASGYQGPTQGQVTSAYNLSNLSGSITVGTQGMQQFTVPTSGGYRIEAWGAQGYGVSGVGGRGAYISGEFQLTAGQVLKIAVGQQGELPSNASYNAQYGGGGGSFVTDLGNSPYVVAGGGGGNWSSNFSTISDAPITTSGNTSGGAGSTASAGGTGGGGGGTANSADGGGGITGNGSGTSSGYAFVNGANGGFVTYGIGGFGGGGGTNSFNNRRSGGGGGYSGGGGAEGVTTGFPEGGGGGSYNSGTNQTNTAGANTGMGKVVITELCAITLSASVNPICIGSSINLSTNATGSISWSTGGTSGIVNVTPSVTTLYTVTGTGTANCTGYAMITVTVNPLPVISAVVVPTLICVGGTATVTASGASTYTWASGPSTSVTSVSPLVNTTYTVSGSNIFGCVSSSTYAVKVSTAAASISASSPSVCSGSPVTLSAVGVNSYTWNTGSFFPSIAVSPTANSTYYLNGRDANFCLLSTSIAIAVVPKPNVAITPDRNLVCKGESMTLTASGAGTYTWSNNTNGNTLSALLPVDVTYTFAVTGMDANGCKDTRTVAITASRCVGINEQAQGIEGLRLFPNPASNAFVIESPTALDGSVEVVDVTGKLVASQKVSGSKASLGIENLAPGLYYVKIQSANGSEVIKLIKE